MGFMKLTVYHGTGDYNLPGFLTKLPDRRSYSHLRHPAFCTTVDLDTATLFALRKTPSDDFLRREITGIVLEFELCGTPGRDFEYVRDPRCLQEENEVAVYNVRRLVLAGVWRYVDDRWVKLGKDDPGLSDTRHGITSRAVQLLPA
jgi:hypothetical protein